MTPPAADLGSAEGFPAGAAPPAAAAPAVDLAPPPLPAAGAEGPPAPPEGLFALWLAAWARDGGRTVVHVARSETRARRLLRAARALAPEVGALLFPPWDCLPCDRASPSRAVMGERMAALCRLREPAPEGGGRLVLTTPEALVQRVPPRDALAGASLRVVPGEALDLEALRLFLLRTGYVVDERVDERVDEAGEAALRGGTVEVFPPDSPHPYRLELDGGNGSETVVVAIRAYDPLTQRSLDAGPAAELLLGPASEILLPEATLARRLAGPSGGEDPPTDRPAAALLDLFLADPADPAAGRAGGGEHMLPLLYAEPETLFDHLPDESDVLLVLDPEAEERREGFDVSVREAHEGRLALRRSEQLAGTAGVLPEPERLYLLGDDWTAEVAGLATVALADRPESDERRLPDLARVRNPHSALLAFARERLARGDRLLLAAADARARRRLARVLARATDGGAARVERWAEIAALPPGSAALATFDLPGGFALPGLAVVAADDVEGRRAATGPGAAAAVAAFAMADLRPGDHVVHADHGIGLLRGLETVAREEDADGGGLADEYLSLEYAGGDRTLVPALEMDRVWRYGSAEAGVTLDRLDGDAWQARREEVEAEIAGTAEALAGLARERAARKAPELVPPRREYARFAARFPYAETGDQARAIEATLADLARGSPPMDRLVCGDVGFGKTEVALRAAAAAALAGRQVAVLAPTTVLARQHLQTFRRRFAGLGEVQVEQLSRLASDKEARATRAGLADGSVRVVVGTHALASPDVRFKDLALVVIDEEQRFGARHKAALRDLRQGAVHVLTMTATPIPRTTQAALAGVQDLSVIATAPVRRQPVRTFVLPFDGPVVREALLRERRRGGRSFVVCPRIADLGPMAERLAGLVPELDVAAAHGRMKADELDGVVLAFADGGHDVLLTTSIIETGLDIPGADTMVVWRPDRFGIAQLHQLRGRVGRGRERAACYLLHDPEAPLPHATERRLKALETLEGLGAGFAIAARDLDLRGAGDLLGEEQAGHLRLIGTGLYQHLLERALRRAAGEGVPDESWSPELRLGVAAAIPADHVPEPEVRLDLYARLAREADVDRLADEIADRFGAPPDAVLHLLALADLRRRCRDLGVAQLDVGPKAAAATFRDLAAAARRFGPVAEAGDLRAGSDGRLVLARESASADERLAAAGALLDRLEAGQAASA